MLSYPKLHSHRLSLHAPLLLQSASSRHAPILGSVLLTNQKKAFLIDEVSKFYTDTNKFKYKSKFCHLKILLDKSLKMALSIENKSIENLRIIEKCILHYIPEQSNWRSQSWSQLHFPLLRLQVPWLLQWSSLVQWKSDLEMIANSEISWFKMLSLR